VLRGNGYLKFSIRVAPAVFHDERSRVCRRQLRHVGRDPPGWGRSSVLTRPQGPCIVADSNSLASARIAFSASALKVSGVQSKGTMSPRRFSGSSSHLRTTIDRFLRRSRFKLSIIRVVITSPFAGHLFLSNSGSFAKFAAIRRASSSAGSAAAPEIEGRDYEQAPTPPPLAQLAQHVGPPPPQSAAQPPQPRLWASCKPGRRAPALS
jgi:hypothetical protein